ncbi:hypothetical protein [Enterococcus sp. 5H]|uniref:hypothetical protein n=1 Tax=Enterococcus sp. 5H TaxID=1229490 RepID=UPI0023035773|nr:hypothetical protein [Enterococcus sp. 5H]MDA9469886.1 hypothetical protein [Enterococcus sp. 5H]
MWFYFWQSPYFLRLLSQKSNSATSIPEATVTMKEMKKESSMFSPPPCRAGNKGDTLLHLEMLQGTVLFLSTGCF